MLSIIRFVQFICCPLNWMINSDGLKYATWRLWARDEILNWLHTGYQKKGRRVRWQRNGRHLDKNNDNHKPRHYFWAALQPQDSKKTISYKSAKKTKSEIWTRRIEFNELSFTIPLSRASPVPSNSYISCDGVLLPTRRNVMNPGITRQTIQSHPPTSLFQSTEHQTNAYRTLSVENKCWWLNIQITATKTRNFSLSPHIHSERCFSNCHLKKQCLLYFSCIPK